MYICIVCVYIYVCIVCAHVYMYCVCTCMYVLCVHMYVCIVCVHVLCVYMYVSFCLEMFKLWYITLIVAVFASQAYSGVINCGIKNRMFNRKLVIKICEGGRMMSIKKLSRDTFKLQMKCNGDNSNFKNSRIKWLKCEEKEFTGTKVELERKIFGGALSFARGLFSGGPDAQSFQALWL